MTLVIIFAFVGVVIWVGSLTSSRDLTRQYPQHPAGTGEVDFGVSSPDGGGAADSAP